MNDRLTEYRSKRDTVASGEPAGRRGRGRDGDRFVISSALGSASTVSVLSDFSSATARQ